MLTVVNEKAAMAALKKELYLEWLNKAARVTKTLETAYLKNGDETLYEAALVILEAKNMLKASLNRQDSGL